MVSVSQGSRHLKSYFGSIAQQMDERHILSIAIMNCDAP